MEEIIKRIIEIDNKAKAISADEKNRNDNIEEFVENEVNTEKNRLDIQYKNEMKNQSSKYNNMFQQKKKEIDADINKTIFQINQKYEKEKDSIVNLIVNNIKKGEENAE